MFCHFTGKIWSFDLAEVLNHSMTAGTSGNSSQWIISLVIGCPFPYRAYSSLFWSTMQRQHSYLFQNISGDLLPGRKYRFQAIVHDEHEILEELRKINKVGSNLNQIARHLNQGV